MELKTEAMLVELPRQGVRQMRELEIRVGERMSVSDLLTSNPLLP